eukprot:TRINITY_DN1381_c0_g1_i2.p1 TRINITY_DN1381_c0_g1~~TRINITY_DN1381_c0_g1_i2.p1  ORF type:complete len:218 (+),score=41.57 TRINITY_DN1381_c0_g1_i2:653-1306(+)
MLRRYKGSGGQQSRSRYQSAGGWGAGTSWEQAEQQQQSYYQQQQQHYSQQQRFSEADLEEAYLAGYHTGQKEATTTTTTFRTAGSLMSFIGGSIAFLIIVVLMTGSSRLRSELETQRKIIAEQEKKINNMKWIMERLPSTDKAKADELQQAQSLKPAGWAQNPQRIPMTQRYRDPSVGGPPRPAEELPVNTLDANPATEQRTASSVISFTWDKLTGK